MNFNFKFTIVNIVGSTIPEFILSKDKSIIVTDHFTGG